MPLILTVENANGASGVRTMVTVPEVGRLDIGRAPDIDWLLPDPQRFISRKHCEIRWRNGTFWLYDVSTNGTFVNGAQRRIVAPHPLRDGDRVAVGAYVLKVAVEPAVAPIAVVISPPPATAAPTLVHPAGVAAVA